MRIRNYLHKYISFYLAHFPHNLDLSAGEYEKYCVEHSSDLNDLEYQYFKLRNAFKNERLSHLNSQLCQLADEKSSDFLQPLEELTESKNERIQVAGVMRDLRTANATSNFDAEMSIIEQDYEVCVQFSLPFI